MVTLKEVHQQGKDLVSTGDPNRSIMVVLTPMKLGVLNLLLANYYEVLRGRPQNYELIKMIREIQTEVQKSVTQILQSQYPPT